MYTPPTTVEFQTLLGRWELSRSQAGDLLALLHDRNRTVGRWTQGARAVPYSVLYTLAVKCQGAYISAEHWREELAIKEGTNG